MKTVITIIISVVVTLGGVYGFGKYQDYKKVQEKVEQIKYNQQISERCSKISWVVALSDNRLTTIEVNDLLDKYSYNDVQIFAQYPECKTIEEAVEKYHKEQEEQAIKRQEIQSLHTEEISKLLK